MFYFGNVICMATVLVSTSLSYLISVQLAYYIQFNTYYIHYSS